VLFVWLVEPKHWNESTFRRREPIRFLAGSRIRWWQMYSTEPSGLNFNLFRSLSV
jgi:hypothetical protein